MANKEVSDLTAASALDGTEVFHAKQGSNSRKATGAQIKTFVNTLNGAMVKKAADQTGANYSGAGTAVAWTAEVYDVGGWHDNSSDNSRLTVPSGVSYVEVAATIRIANGTNEVAGIILMKNGSTSFDGNAHSAAVSGGTNYSYSFKSGAIAVTAGDYFEVLLFTSADTSIDVIAARSNFSIRALA